MGRGKADRHVARSVPGCGVDGTLKACLRVRVVVQVLPAAGRVPAATDLHRLSIHGPALRWIGVHADGHRPRRTVLRVGLQHQSLIIDGNVIIAVGVAARRQRSVQAVSIVGIVLGKRRIDFVR